MIALIWWVLLCVWVVGWLSVIFLNGGLWAPHWSLSDLTEFVLLVGGYPLGSFLLWRLSIWILRWFFRAATDIAMS